MIFDVDILNECLRNADAFSKAETYNKMFGNISSLASSSSITEDRTYDSSSMMPLFPLVMKVAEKTIGYDLVSPIDDEFSEITEDGELIELENDGMTPPSGKILFMDFKQP